MTDYNLSPHMEKALYSLYKDYKLYLPFKPVEAHGNTRVNKNTLRALTRRQLAKEHNNGHIISSYGRKYIESRYDTNNLSRKLSQNQDIKRCRRYYANYESMSLERLSIYASFWAERAQALYIESIKDWDKGGIVTDWDKHRLANHFKWLAVFAYEDVNKLMEAK